jgi:hypothetical protein
MYITVEDRQTDKRCEGNAQTAMNLKPRGGLVLVTLLVECGADVNAVNKYNRTRERQSLCSFWYARARACVCRNNAHSFVCIDVFVWVFK